MAKLNEEDIRVVAYLEQLFWETGLLATNERVSLDLNISIDKVKKCWKNPDFRQSLIARGLDLNVDKSSRALEPRQVMAANIILNTYDRRSVREKLELVNVTPQQFAAWKRQPPFQAYLQTRSEEMLKAAGADANVGLVKSVESGDLTAIKFWMELTGKYNPKLDVNINVEGLLARVVDVVARHVTPEVMEAIANELEGVVNPTPVGVVRELEPAFNNVLSI